MSTKKTTKKKVLKKKTPKTSVPYSVSDRKWREESDANTLATAEDIKKDPVRLKGAEKQAVIMVKKQEKSLNSIKKVAKITAKSK